MRVLVEHGSVSANVACLITFLLANGGNAAGREACGAGTNKFGKPPAKLTLRLSGG